MGRPGTSHLFRFLFCFQDQPGPIRYHLASIPLHCIALPLSLHVIMSVFMTQAFKRDHAEEWKKVDDDKIKRLRGILASMQEESQCTQLLKKDRENWDVQSQLDQTRRSVGSRLQECKKKKTVFEKKQEELRRVVSESEQYIRDTDTKIEKSEKKAKDEQAECRKLDEELKALGQELEENRERKEVEVRRIQQNSHFKRYLDSVVFQFDEDFEGDIENLMNRHLTLEAGNEELHNANEKLTAELDKTREEWLRVQAKLQNDQLMINSTLHECQMNLEKYRAESADLENRLNQALEEKELKESNIGIINMAIEQIFQRTVSTCRLPQRKKAMQEAVETKFGHRLDLVLQQITQRVTELQWICDKASAALKPETMAMNTTNLLGLDDESGSFMDRVEYVKSGVPPGAGNPKAESAGTGAGPGVPGGAGGGAAPGGSTGVGALAGAPPGTQNSNLGGKQDQETSRKVASTKQESSGHTFLTED